MPRQEKSINPSEYASVYDNIRGVGTGKCDVSYTENMYLDRKSGLLESIPGSRVLSELPYAIKNMFIQHANNGEEILLIHAGPYLYRIAPSELEELSGVSPVCEIGERKAVFAESKFYAYAITDDCIVEIDGTGSYTLTESDNDSNAYSAKTFVNGERTEYRNLLNRCFTETFEIDVADDYTYGTPQLIYSITDKEKKKCAVVGIGEDHGTVIHIPRYKLLNGVQHMVTEIGPNAFSGKSGITEIITNRGLEKIGSAAMISMPDLTKVVLSDSVREIGDYCLAMCMNLEHLYIGSSLEKIGKAAFAACGDMKIDYAGSSDMLKEVENMAVLGTAAINYYVRRSNLTVAIPIFTDYEEIQELKIDGSLKTADLIDPDRGAVISISDPAEIVGKKITLEGLSADKGGVFVGYGRSVSPMEMILGCTVCHSYNGRIFLSGNPKLPGVVFYSSKASNGNEVSMYFPENSYISVGNAEVTAMATIGQSLAIFTKSYANRPNVFLYKPKSGGGEVGYNLVSSFGHKTVKGATNFLGEAICLSDDRVSRFRGSTGKCTDFECISSNITDQLKRADGPVTMTEWNDYLVLGIGADVFLLDISERQSYGASDDYEWYHISGLGGYTDDLPLFVYSSESYKTLLIHGERVGEPKPDRLPVMSVIADDGSKIYYIEEDEQLFRVSETPYRYGGVPDQISVSVNLDGRLIFGTASGRLLTLNTDMLGIPPEHIREKADFNAAKYERDFGSRLHPFFYTFSSHIPSYKVALAADCCGKPYLTKSTLRESTSVSLTPFSGKVYCEAIYDSHKKLSLGTVKASLEGMSQSEKQAQSTGTPEAQSEHCHVSHICSKLPYTILCPGQRDWTEVQYLFAGEGLSPFSIRSLAFRYTFEDNQNKKIY